MKLIEQINVSFYKNVYQKSPQQVKLIDILGAIVKGKYAGVIHTIRRYHQEEDKEAVQKLKSSLPCFTVSGVFNGVHAIRNLAEVSGCVVIDFDHVADIGRARKLCSEDPHTLAVFASPTDGLKVIAYVEQIEGRHREAYRMVSGYYNRLTGLQCDEACKDESRLCYVSYDPDAYIAALYEAFEIPSLRSDNPDGGIEEFVMSYLFLNPMVEGKRNSTLFKLACEACKRGYPENMLYSELCTHMQDSDFPKEEIIRVLSSGYKHVASNSNENLSPPSIIPQKDKWTKSSNNPPIENPAEEESYWQGEELRKQTPFIPGEVYKNIPALLRNCQLDDCSLRERDLLLLSAITSLSAMLPQTFGVYNHRMFSPHLYTFCLAPAGSGKGVVQWGAKLLYSLHKSIVEESEAKADEYRCQRQEWAMECARKAKSKEQVDMKNEPKEPPYRCLIIPATTSNSRLQLQLRDNGALGGIIFDTEARTMTNANKLDCGHFDDILCKAFGHELISSSYKANGMKPIVVHHPRLAVFLTGTPEQLNHLLETPESGLSSRFLFYTYREKPVWKQMGDDAYDMDDQFTHYSEEAHRLYLFCRAHPLRFSFTRAQWNRLNDQFSEMLLEVVSESNDNLQAVVKRYAFITMRIAMILSRLERYEGQSTSAECSCSEACFETALHIVLCCYEHSRLLFTSIPVKNHYCLKDPNEKRRFFDSIPNDFSTEDVHRFAANYSFSARTAMRYIKQLIGLKVCRISHGKFRKL